MEESCVNGIWILILKIIKEVSFNCGETIVKVMGFSGRCNFEEAIGWLLLWKDYGENKNLQFKEWKLLEED